MRLLLRDCNRFVPLTSQLQRFLLLYRSQFAVVNSSKPSDDFIKGLDGLLGLYRVQFLSLLADLVRLAAA